MGAFASTELSSVLAGSDGAGRDGRPAVKALCLHGKGTSGHIFSMQTGALRRHLEQALDGLVGVFPDAPFSASGQIDEGVLTFYPSPPNRYYEWYCSDSKEKTLAASLKQLVRFARKHGPFDLLVGFSQGCEVVARLALLCQRQGVDVRSMFKCAVCVGGVCVDEAFLSTLRENEVVDLPSLHLLGEHDPYLPRSEALADLFSERSRAKLYHCEAHNVPSVRTGLYDSIAEWIKANSK